MGFDPVRSLVHDEKKVERLFRIRLREGAWHVVEVVLGGVGGIFASLADAVAFARAEARGLGGARVVIDFEGNA